MLVLGAFVLGCDAPDPSPLVDVTGPLVVPDGWSASRLDHDPFVSHRPAAVTCPDAGWGVEGTSVEVSTGDCNYLSVEQPLLLDVPEGTRIVVNLWHQVLHAERPATGHAALVVGDDLLWEREVAIPGPGAVHGDVVIAPRDLRASERVVFHLHNHGVNTWNLGDVFADGMEASQP
ncbi:MAG: hypothetical protein AAGA54_17485 [Myxococcota bacterium]